MRELSACAKEILDRGLDDWIQAAEIASVVMRHATDVRTVAIATIRELVDDGLVTVGDLTGDGFVPWNLPARECLARIEREWPTRRSPDLGEVCWLSNTEAGDAFARLLGG